MLLPHLLHTLLAHPYNENIILIFFHYQLTSKLFRFERCITNTLSCCLSLCNPVNEQTGTLLSYHNKDNVF